MSLWSNRKISGYPNHFERISRHRIQSGRGRGSFQSLSKANVSWNRKAKKNSGSPTSVKPSMVYMKNPVA